VACIEIVYGGKRGWRGAGAKGKECGGMVAEWGAQTRGGTTIGYKKSESWGRAAAGISPTHQRISKAPIVITLSRTSS